MKKKNKKNKKQQNKFKKKNIKKNKKKEIWKMNKVMKNRKKNKNKKGNKQTKKVRQMKRVKEERRRINISLELKYSNFTKLLKKKISNNFLNIMGQQEQTEINSSLPSKELKEKSDTFLQV